MSILKELIALKEEQSKLSFGAFQKYLYAAALKEISGKDAASVVDAAKDLIHSSDTFWTSGFDDAYKQYERAMDGRFNDSIYDDIGYAVDQVIENIVEYYRDPMNFAPGYKKPTLNDPSECDVDAVIKTIPGLNEIVAARDEHQGTINMMHRDFSKLAKQQRPTKAGKEAVQPYEEAIAKVCAHLRSDGAYITSINVSEDDIVFDCTLEDHRGNVKSGASYASDNVHIPGGIFSDVQVKKSNSSWRNWREYTFIFAHGKEPSETIRPLIQKEANQYTDKG